MTPVWINHDSFSLTNDSQINYVPFYNSMHSMQSENRLLPWTVWCGILRIRCHGNLLTEPLSGNGLFHVYALSCKRASTPQQLHISKPLPQQWAIPAFRCHVTIFNLNFGILILGDIVKLEKLTNTIHVPKKLQFFCKHVWHPRFKQNWWVTALCSVLQCRTLQFACQN
jgi:hypothetical protein